MIAASQYFKAGVNSTVELSEDEKQFAGQIMVKKNLNKLINSHHNIICVCLHVTNIVPILNPFFLF